MSRHRPSDHTDSPPQGPYDTGHDAQGWWTPPADPMHIEFQAMPPAAAAPKRRRRIFPWVFLAVQAIFLVWVITGASSGGGTPPSCARLTGQALQTCQNAGHAGTAIGVGLIVVVWVAVDVILALSYLFARLLRRR